MRRVRLFALVSMLLACFGLLACDQAPAEDEHAVKAAEDWAWLQQAKAELESKREVLAQLRDQVANYDPASAAKEGEGEAAEAPPTLEELTARIATLEPEVFGLTDAFGSRLAQFINEQQISVGSERSEIQSQAIGMKTDEDIELARDYIDRGGEYQRAIDIYKQAMIFDPDNEKLVAAMASAEELRNMSEERFAQVEKGMTEGEVRRLLGQPKATNIRQYEETGVTAWFYPKEEPNTAAGIFFQKKKDVLKVYKTDFDAIKGPQNES